MCGGRISSRPLMSYCTLNLNKNVIGNLFCTPNLLINDFSISYILYTFTICVGRVLISYMKTDFQWIIKSYWYTKHIKKILKNPFTIKQNKRE